MLAAVADEDDIIRKFASENILLARASQSADRIRCFSKKNIKINFSASSYIQMIDWENIHIDSPPLLIDVSSETIATNIQINLPDYPCHSQCVEGNIKDVSAVCVCAKVYGHDSRHSVII